MNLWLGTLLGGLSTAILFNVPRRLVPLAPLAGLAGLLALQLVEAHYSRPGALFVAAFAVGMASELLARWQGVPALVFSVNGILPLVPGAVAYRGMAATVRADYLLAAELLTLALLSAGAIATGLLLASALWRLRPRPRLSRAACPGG